MRYYCTYFDRHYLLRGLALYRSLQAHGEPFTLWVLCFDAESCDALRRLDRADLVPIPLDDFERGDAELLAAKQDRSRVEYYFTCTPSLPRYILDRSPQVDLITYLDADLFFYASPEPIFDELGDGSILIVAHRFPPGRPHLWLSGIYNVGLLAFRRDARARECLEWWRARCLEWCYDRMEPGRFADQKYLLPLPRAEVFQPVGLRPRERRTLVWGDAAVAPLAPLPAVPASAPGDGGLGALRGPQDRHPLHRRPDLGLRLVPDAA